MKRTTAMLCALSLALAGGRPTHAQSPPLSPDGGKALTKAGSAAEEELSRSVSELNAMRERIAGEKLPLAQELTGLEEKVIALRRESDRVQRLVDAGALEIGTMQAEMKARQDELTYISSLLDEYARAFETKINVGEVQVFASPIEAAKSAVENKTLTPSERFGAQTKFVDLSMQRLFDAIGGHRFAGTAVDMLGTVLQGQFAMIGPITLFSGDSGDAGIPVPQPGSPNPVVRTLEGPLATAVRPLVASGEGTLPLDPSRGGALKALVQKASLIHIFIKGGPIMWPMLFASILALTVALERVVFLVNEKRRRSTKAVADFFVRVGKGDLGGAVDLSKKSRDPIVTTLGYALEHRDQSLGHALTYAETSTIKRYKRGLSVLDTVITLAPLMGLLGTVTGMMGSFAVIGGDLSSPGAITGGIAEALIATAFGLVIAITCLIPFNYLNSRIEGMESELLASGEQLKLLVEGRPAVAPTAASLDEHALALGVPAEVEG